MDQWTLPSPSERREMMRAESRNSARQQADGSRIAPRICIHANVTAESEDNFFSGITENISQGGVFVSSYSPPAVGERVRLKLSVDGSGDLVVTGEVRWLRTEEDGTETGCGVQFDNMPSAQKDHLMSLVSTLRREPLLSGF